MSSGDDKKIYKKKKLRWPIRWQTVVVPLSSWSHRQLVTQCTSQRGCEAAGHGVHLVLGIVAVICFAE